MDFIYVPYLQIYAPVNITGSYLEGNFSHFPPETLQNKLKFSDLPSYILIHGIFIQISMPLNVAMLELMGGVTCEETTPD